MINDRSIRNELAVVQAFKQAGFGIVKPYDDVLTFPRWMAKGFRPLKGSKSVRVGSLRLFHKSQVCELSAEEQKAMQDRSDAAMARCAGNVIQLHP